MKKKIEKRGFTIVELLTVMSIIVILISLLIPSLNAVRRYSKVVRQKGQFHDLGKGLEMFSIDFDGYPDSSRYDIDKAFYCGAMKMCEAMVGQDGLGFHPDSRFDDMGQDENKEDLYFNRITPTPEPPYSPQEEENLRARKLPYIENIDICSLKTLFRNVVGDFDQDCVVLCDVFSRSQLQAKTGKRVGMPVLYYKADSSKLEHDPNGFPDVSRNIYDVFDNYDLTRINPVWEPTTTHPLYELGGVQGEVFYQITKDPAVEVIDKPHNTETYILLSAGWDGLYGTSDDIFNFTD